MGLGKGWDSPTMRISGWTTIGAKPPGSVTSDISTAVPGFFYETAGIVKVFVFVFAFAFSLSAFLFLLLLLLLFLPFLVPWIHLGLH
jgi:hypothetical protein